MANSELSSLLFLLLVLLGSAHLLGQLFVRLRQPKVMGEILAGVLLGPSLLGHFPRGADLEAVAQHHAPVINFLYSLGLLLLMFISGAETRELFSREDRRAVAWLASVGTLFPFLAALALSPFLTLGSIAGTATSRAALVIVLAISVSVTSIPVISRIFADLKILQTRFARLVLGVAVLEDIALWAALAVATALAGAAAVSPTSMALHLAATAVYFALGLTLAPRLVKRVSKMDFNVVAQSSPVGYVIAVLLGYCAVAGAIDVSLVFAAFLAGFAVVHKKRRLFADALEAISKFSFAVFIPIYFVIVGLKLDLSKNFSLRMFALFLLGSCVLKVMSVGVGAWLAGFRGWGVANLAIATNARGGPGIVLASVAYDAGIIGAAFYTTLVLVAVLTSMIAGGWLEWVMRKGIPLLGAEAQTTTVDAAAMNETA